MTRRKLTVDEADAILRAEAEDAKRVASAINRHSDELEQLLQDVGRGKLFPHIVVAVFGLLEVVCSLVWAAGLNKSSDMEVTIRSCISRKGKDRLHEARLSAIEYDRRSGNHD